MAGTTSHQEHLWIHQAFIGAIVFILLVSISIILRSICAIWTKKTCMRFDWEQLSLFGSYIAFIAICAAVLVALSEDEAHASPTSLVERYRHAAKLNKAAYVVDIAYVIACSLPKISICLMYLDLFDVDKKLRRATQLIILFLVVNSIAWLVPMIFQCHPISALWTFPRNLDQCIDYDVLVTWTSLPLIVSDLFIFILPLPMLWKMHISRSKKIGVTITFFTGSLGMMGGCARLAYFIHVKYVNKSGGSLAASAMLAYVEPGMYLIAACLPRLRPLLRQLHASMSSTSTYFSMHVHPLHAESDQALNILDPHDDREMPSDDMDFRCPGDVEILARETPIH